MFSRKYGIFTFFQQRLHKLSKKQLADIWEGGRPGSTFSRENFLHIWPAPGVILPRPASQPGPAEPVGFRWLGSWRRRGKSRPGRRVLWPSGWLRQRRTASHFKLEPPGQRHCQTVELGTELYRALENDPCVWLIGAVPKFQEEYLPAEIMNIFCTRSAESPDLIRPGALRRPGIPGSVQLKKYDKYIPSIYQTYVTAQ